MPIGRAYPDHVAITIRATLPMEFDLPDEAHRVEDPAFRFRYEKVVHPRDLELSYEYESLSDSVAPEQASAYLDHLDQTWGLLHYSLWWEPGSRPFWTRQRKLELATMFGLFLLLMTSPAFQVLAHRALRAGRLARSISCATWARRWALASPRPVLRRAALSLQLARLQLLAGRHAEAEALATAALQRTAHGGELANAIHVDALYCLCSLRMRQKRYDEADDYLGRAQQAASSLHAQKPLQRAARVLLRVSVRAKRGDTSGAREAIDMAEALAMGDRVLAYEVAGVRATVLEADGDPHGAREALLRHVRMAEETFGPEHLFAKEARRELAELEERCGPDESSRG